MPYRDDQKSATPLWHKVMWIIYALLFSFAFFGEALLLRGSLDAPDVRSGHTYEWIEHGSHYVTKTAYALLNIWRDLFFLNIIVGMVLAVLLGGRTLPPQKWRWFAGEKRDQA